MYIFWLKQPNLCNSTTETETETDSEDEDTGEDIDYYAYDIADLGKLV